MTAVQIVHLRCDQIGCLSEWTGRTGQEYDTRRTAANQGWRRIIRPDIIDDYCPAHAGNPDG